MKKSEKNEIKKLEAYSEFVKKEIDLIKERFEENGYELSGFISLDLELETKSTRSMAMLNTDSDKMIKTLGSALSAMAEGDPACLMSYIKEVEKRAVMQSIKDLIKDMSNS